MKLMRAWFLLLILLFSSACSVYRSEDRKQFESQKFDFSKSAFYLLSCSSISNPITYSEQLLSASFLKDSLTDETALWVRPQLNIFEVTSLSPTTACQWVFENEASYKLWTPELLEALQSTKGSAL